MATPRPKRVLLGPFAWALHWGQPPAAPDAMGYCDKGRKAIYIAPHSHPIEQVDTLIHEILHAIYSQRGIYTADNRGEEEHLVHQFAGGLTEVMARNPKLVDWIQEQLTCTH